MAERKVLEEFELADGRKVKVYEGKVRDLITAQKQARDGERIVLALMSRLVEIDGRRLAMEEWEEENMGAFLEVISRVLPLWGLSRMTLPLNVWPSQDQPAGA